MGFRISFRKSVDIPRYFHDHAFDTVETLVDLGEALEASEPVYGLAPGDHRVTSVISGPKLLPKLKTF